MYNSVNLPLSPLKVVKKSAPSVIRSAIMLVVFWWVLQNMYQATTGPNLLGETNPVFAWQLWWLRLALLTFAIAPAIIKIIYEYFYYKLYYYNFEEDKAEIRKGVISRATGFVRYNRLQNIYIDQDFWDRVFGLYDVHYETAGEKSGFYSHVDGLKRENAQKLVDFLNDRAKNQPHPELQSPVPQPLVTPDENPTIAMAEISSKTHPLAPLFLWAGMTSSLVIWGVIALFMYAFVKIAAPEFPATRAIVAGTYITIKALAFVYMRLFIGNFEFELGPEAGRVRTQVIAQSISHFYYNRVQNINISQGVFDRLFGLYSVTIETAGEASGSELVLPGFRKEQAEEIKAFLLQKAQKARGL